MRFKAKISNVPLLLKIVQTVEKSAKKCIIQLGPDVVLFILSPENVEEGLHIWSNVKVRALFFQEEYRIESMKNNEIAFEVYLENLRTALRSALTSEEIFVKLSKKDKVPYLSFTIKSFQANQEVLVCQDVPILLMTQDRMKEITEPSLPDPKVHLALPNLKILQNVVEAMKNLGNFLLMHADLAGNLTLTVETDAVQMTSFFRELEIPSIEGRSPIVPTSSVSVTAKVDIRIFSKFLHSSTVDPSNVICCFVEDQAVILHVLLEDMFMTYYLPIIPLEDVN